MTQTHYLATPAGLPLTVEADPSAQTIAIAIYFRAGSAYQGEVPGSAHFLEHCLLNGSHNYPNEQSLQWLIDEVGAQSNGMTSRQYVKYFFHCLPDYLERCSQWLREVVCRPLFDEATTILERGAIVNERAQKYNKGNFVHNCLLQRAYYGDHPYGVPGIGTLESIQTMSPDYIRALYRRLYVKQNAQVAIVGPITLEAAIELTDKLFGELPDGDEQPIITAPTVWEPCRLLQTLPRLSQDYYSLGYPHFGWEDERYYAAEIIGNWLNRKSMPLYRKLREELAWIYGLDGGVGFDYRSGSLGVGGQIAAEHREEVLAIIREYIARLCNDLVEPKDLDVLRNRRRMGFVIDEQEVMERLGSIGYYSLFARNAIDRRAELERGLGVTCEEIRDVAQAVFSGPEKVVITTNQ